MITIVKGKDKIVCTKATYEEQYRQLGYRTETKKDDKRNILSTDIVTNVDNEKENDKIGAKYGVKRKTINKKEED